MLEELSIRDLGVIEDVTLRFGPGLNVLTGETGAGKTMVISAVELLLGARGDSHRVRTGAAVAVVEGRLHPIPAEARAWVDERDEDLVVSREIAVEGRSRARLGGRMAPVSALAEVVGGSVELHGQQDTARLSSPGTQRELLDRFGGTELAEAKFAYVTAFEAWKAVIDELSVLRADERDRIQEVDRLRFELGELDDLAPVEGEEDRLDEELSRLEHADTLELAARGAHDMLSREGGARDGLGQAVAIVRTSHGLDGRLDELAARAEGLLAEVQELGLELGGYADALAPDPERLEALRARSAALAGLTWKYVEGAAKGVIDTRGLVSAAEAAHDRLARLEGGEERLAVLSGELEAHERVLSEAAESLTAARREAGERLAATVEAHLGELAMEKATMSVSLDALEPGPTGADRVTFLLAANPGEGALPLGKAASGGERSRVALALRLALADADATPVLVFDEVDAGIGGSTALAVGRKLAQLACGRQVLIVTHLPQLAAFADVHFVVSKDEQEGRTVAAVSALEEPARVRELSRMLSGTPDSERAAAHAAELRATALQGGAPRPPVRSGRG